MFPASGRRATLQDLIAGCPSLFNRVAVCQIAEVYLKGRTACAGFYDDAQRLRRAKPKRQAIFRLLLQQFGAIVGKTTNGNHPSPATLWWVTVEAWLRCQGLIAVRQNQKPNVSTTFQKLWSHN